jgi:hypothetical protein
MLKIQESNEREYEDPVEKIRNELNLILERSPANLEDGIKTISELENMINAITVSQEASRSLFEEKVTLASKVQELERILQEKDQRN